MQENHVDLVNIFQTITQSLEENQQNLNQADVYNQDHGRNMVETFHTITSALEKKKGSSDSAALAYAARTLSRKATSGSGKQYAENLNRAATEFKGRKVDERAALELLQTLIGGSQGGQASPEPPAGSDLMSALLGGMAGGAPSQGSSDAGSDAGGDLMSALLGGMAGGAPSQGSSDAGGDLMSALLGGMAGGSPQSSGSSSAGGDLLGALLGGAGGSGSSSQGGLNLQTLLAAGMAYLKAKQSGQGNLQALIQAFMAGSGMGRSPYRTQSTELVVQSFLEALGN